MRKVFWLVAVLALLYCGYWVLGAKGTEKGIAAWIRARSAEGWQAEVSDISTGGFPLRFDTTLSHPQFADPRSGVALSTSQIDILSQSFRPTRFTARFAPEALLSTPYEKLTITQDLAEAQLFVDPGPRLTLDHASVQLDGLKIVSTNEWSVALDHAQFNTQRSDDDPLEHDITFIAEGFAPSQNMARLLQDQDGLSDTFETLDMDMTARFDAPWDIRALAGPRPQPTHITLRAFSAQWGALTLRLAGDFVVDAEGYPTGTLAVKAENWREMIAVARSVGTIPQDMASIAERAGGILAGLSGRKDTIDAELTVKNGTISLGILPLGPAPRLRIR